MSSNHSSNGIGTIENLNNPNILFEDLIGLEEKMKNLYKRASKVFDHNNLISFSQLANFQELLDTQIAQGVHTKRLPIPLQSGMFFQCLFQASSELGVHHHDCYELITIESGAIIDMENGQIFHPGEEYLLKPGQAHNIKSLESRTTLYILFTKDAPY